MNKLMIAIIGAVVCATASAETLPSWAVGVFKGDIKNWCYVYDDPSDVGPWYGNASFTVTSDGKLSGEISLDALNAKPTGQYTIKLISDSEVRLAHEFRWTENGRYLETGMANIYIRNSNGSITLEYDDEEYVQMMTESCPVQGVLKKQGNVVSEYWKKARTLRGVATRAMPNPVVGVFEIKCGKANKKGEAKVSASLTGLDGKTTKYKAKSVNVTGGTVTVDFGGLLIDIADDSFSGSEGVPGGLSVESADVGGNWTRTDAKVYVDFKNGSALPSGVQESLLPYGEPVLPKGGKWAFNKAATVKLQQEASCCGMPSVYMVMTDTSKGKTNLSGLKLTYTPKTGLFKGPFKMYALDGSGSKKKLKKYTVNVTGVVVDGNGYGQATIKKPAATWFVSVM